MHIAMQQTSFKKQPHISKILIGIFFPPFYALNFSLSFDIISRAYTPFSCEKKVRKREPKSY